MSKTESPLNRPNPPQPPVPRFTVREVAGQTVVQFQTDSLTSTRDLERVGLDLYRLIDERTGGRAAGPAAPAAPGRFQLVLDFAKVNFFSSQAVGLLLGLNKKLARGRVGTLTLCGVGPHLLQLLRITRLDQMLQIAPTHVETVAPGDEGAK